MAALVWDTSGDRWYETGLDRGVVYPMDTKGEYSEGFAWNGLTAFTKSPSGAEASKIYADNTTYAVLRSVEEFAATIEAYMYPPEFALLDGTKSPIVGLHVGQQARGTFGFSCRTKMGNDTASEDDDAYKLHLVYGLTASPSEKSYSTTNDSPEAITFSWECESVPVTVTKMDGVDSTSELVIQSNEIDATKLKALEAILYGSASEAARLPLPDEVFTILGGSASEVASQSETKTASTKSVTA
jgi:hypothetical protein